MQSVTASCFLADPQAPIKCEMKLGNFGMLTAITVISNARVCEVFTRTILDRAHSYLTTVRGEYDEDLQAFRISIEARPWRVCVTASSTCLK